jgi:hypothetical protein
MPMAANAQMAMIAAQMFDAMSLWLGCTAGLGAAPAGPRGGYAMHHRRAVLWLMPRRSAIER